MNTRTEHLKWCKDRALEYVKLGDLNQALASMTSDVLKHPETANHGITCGLGLSMRISGHLNTKEQMIEFIKGFN